MTICINASGDAESTYRRAEELLVESRECVGARRHDLVEEAVLLTVDLADSVARRYRGRGVDSDDLRQVARMGLVKAAHRYRPDRGSSFAAYAVPTMTGEIKRYFRDTGWLVRPPRRVQEARVDLERAEGDLRQRLRREPTVQEVAHLLDFDLQSVIEIRQSSGAYRAVSLDAPTATGTPFGDGIASSSDEFDAFEVRECVGRTLRGLTEREQRIVWLRFVEERTQSEIGQALGVSQMQVSRLLSQILGRLRDDLTASAA